MANNQQALDYIIEIIKKLEPLIEVRTFQKDHYNHHFISEFRDETVEIVFGRDTIDDFQSLMNGNKNSDQYKGIETFIKFRVYIALGKAGLIPYFSIAKQLLEEKREWSKNLSISFSRQEWLYGEFGQGLKKLARFLDNIIEKYGVQPELQKEKEDIIKLLSYYNKNKTFTSSGVTETSLGYLKAAAVVMILEKEKERLEIKVPRILHAKNKEIYKIVEELRKDIFLQIKMPDCVFDYAANNELVNESEGSDVQMINVPCGPLAKQTCDLKSNIEREFSEKNVFLDIPYSNYDDCEKALRELLNEFGLDPIVAKDKLTSNAVLCKVCKLVKTCKYGITDISSASNSVSYEYGLMHGLGMKVCLLLRTKCEKFSDIHGLEHVSYDDLRSFRIAVSKWILENVEGVEQSKVKRIIQEEESLLKEKGELPLQDILSTNDAVKDYKILENWKVQDDDILGHVDRLIESFAEGNIEFAAKEAAFVFDKSFRLWKKNYQSKMGTLGLGNQSMEELVRNNVLNVNLAEYYKFINFVPTITWFENGSFQIRIKRSYKSDSDKENLKFCVNFLFNLISVFEAQVSI